MWVQFRENFYTFPTIVNQRKEITHSQNFDIPTNRSIQPTSTSLCIFTQKFIVDGLFSQVNCSGYREGLNFLGNIG